MTTAGEMISLMTLSNELDSYTYSYYMENFGFSKTQELFGEKKTRSSSKIDRTKSREYNDIIKDMNTIIRELDNYQKSLQKNIKDITRKIRDVERLSSTNFEDYNNTYRTLSEFKKKELEAIVKKGDSLVKKHDLLQKQFKLEKDSGTSKSKETFSGTPAAQFIGALQQNTVEQPNTIIDNMRQNISDIKEEDPRSYMCADDDRDYQLDMLRYGSAIKDVYVLDPNTGFGYIKYTAPDGYEGERPFTVREFQNSMPNYDNMTIKDASNTIYPIEVGEVPSNVTAEWEKYFENGNQIAIKK